MSEATQAGASASCEEAQRGGVDAPGCGGDVPDGWNSPARGGAKGAAGLSPERGTAGDRIAGEGGRGGECPTGRTVHNPAPFYGPEIHGRVSRPLALPPVVMYAADGTPRPAPFLLTMSDVADLFRLRDSGVRFPCRTIRRYRQMGLRSVRMGRRVYIRLDDALAFLALQQDRLVAK